jgi:ankyrin repeat protein
MKLRLTSLFVLVATVALAQPADQFYAAIRNNDLAALRALVKTHGVNLADSRGQTPLMFAAAFGSLESFRFLLASGADAGAASDFGVTPLHWAAGDAKKAQLLLSKKVDVNAKSQIGRTPLIVAASNNGASAIVGGMLAKGADVNAADSSGITALQAAASCSDLDSVRVLLNHGADPNAHAVNTGFTALMNAASAGNTEMVRLLLSRKANANAVSSASTGTVKNGPIAIGYMTALHWAGVNGGPAMVKLLLDAGAKVDPQDVRGMTPLMASVATDHASPEVVRLLLQKGADANIRSKAGETTLDWARKFNNPAVLTLLKLEAQTPRASVAPVADTARQTPRQAVERALPVLQRASDYIFKDSGCVPCHAHTMTELAAVTARARGWRVNEDLSKQSMQAIVNSLTTGAQPLMQSREGGGQPDTMLYAIFALAGNKAAPDFGTDAVVQYIASRQLAEGNWKGVGGTRAPIQDGDFSRTALAIRALSFYGMAGRKIEMDKRIAQAAKWLAAETPFATEPRVMQLLGLHWAKAAAAAKATRLRELIAMQRVDGGWGQTPYLDTDAYATGQVLYTLHELGVAATDPAFRKGIDFLLRTQKDDGTWYVKNRAMKLQPYFESGFPYEHDQWISASSTAWASMALTLSEPQPASVASR